MFKISKHSIKWKSLWKIRWLDCGMYSQKRKSWGILNSPLFFKFYWFFNLVFSINHLIGVFFVCFEFIVDILFDCKCYNTLLVGFSLESLFIELQGYFLVFEIFLVYLFESNFDFDWLWRLFVLMFLAVMMLLTTTLFLTLTPLYSAVTV